MEKMSSHPKTTGESFAADLFSKIHEAQKAAAEQPASLLDYDLPDGTGYSKLSVNPSIIHSINAAQPGLSSEILIVGYATRPDGEAESVVATFNVTSQPLESTLRIQPIIPQQAA